MKKNQEPNNQPGKDLSSEKILKEIIDRKKAEKKALKKIIASLEKKRKPNI